VIRKESSNDAKQWLQEHNIEYRSSLSFRSKEVNGWLGRMSLTMLHHAGRPIPFWTEAYTYATQIKFVLPFKTGKGFMSAYEYLTDTPPSVRHFRVWGCKAFVLEPRNEHRKDFHAPSVIGFFLKLSTEPLGWTVWVPELCGPVVSTNVDFDEVIPDPGVEYHRELSCTEVPIAPDALSLGEVAQNYEKKIFIDDEDGLIYEVLKIRRTRDGYLVADVKARGAKVKERTPLHIADMIRMVDISKNTDESIRALRSLVLQTNVNQGAQNHMDTISMIMNGMTSFSDEIDVTLGKSNSRRDASPTGEHIDIDNFIKCDGDSTRETLLLTNEEVGSQATQDVDLVIMPTEIVEEVEAIMLLQYANDCEDLNYVLHVDALKHSPPYDRFEMLQLPPEERARFMQAEEKELSALEELGVIEDIVPIPPGVKPVGCRYVYTVKDAVSQEGKQLGDETIAKARLTMKDFKKWVVITCEKHLLQPAEASRFVY
jgi:hypothetical protein